MTTYVNLQVAVIRTLRDLKEDHPELLKEISERYCVPNGEERPPYLNELHSFGLPMSAYSQGVGYDWVEKTIPEIIQQQIVVEGDKIAIRNLLGFPLENRPPMNFDEFIDERGSGGDRLRTLRFAQPGALKEGDVLANGDRLISPPREGGNGSILIHLTGGSFGRWMDVPACIPIALLTLEDKAPLELVVDWTPQTR